MNRQINSVTIAFIWIGAQVKGRKSVDAHMHQESCRASHRVTLSQASVSKTPPKVAYEQRNKQSWWQREWRGVEIGVVCIVSCNVWPGRCCVGRDENEAIWAGSRKLGRYSKQCFCNFSHENPMTDECGRVNEVAAVSDEACRRQAQKT